jgi:hypothetical protein
MRLVALACPSDATPRATCEDGARCEDGATSEVGATSEDGATCEDGAPRGACVLRPGAGTGTLEL